MSNKTYHFLNHIDAPYRMLTLTIDEFVVCAFMVLLLIGTSQKIVVTLLGLSLFSGLRFLKKGQGPKFLLVLVYWHLPSSLTRYFLPQLPLSHHRMYLA